MDKSIFSADGGFARLMNLLWDLICISILWVLCCIPVLTAGVATTAAYYTMAKVVRHHNGGIFSEFFSSFRMNFRQGIFFSAIYAVIFLILIFDCSYFFNNQAENSLAFLYGFYMMIALTAANTFYLYPFLSRFYMKKMELFRVTALCVFRHLLTTVLLLLLFTTMLICVYLMPWGILVFPGVMLYLQTFLMEPILLRYAPKTEPNSEESQKWYYQ